MMIPGRILVIDDVPDEVIKVVDSLREKGENVIYTKSIPEDTFFENLRLIIVDLYLIPNDKDASYETLSVLFEKITQRTSFFIVAIWTKYARNREEDKKIIIDLKKLYKERTGSEIRAVFLEPFGKDIPQEELVEKLAQAMSSHPECGLFFEIEKLVEKARDRTVSEIVNAASIPSILKALREELGESALPRRTVELFLKVLCRYCRPTNDILNYAKALIASHATTDVDTYGHIHNLQSYYEVSMDEPVWTGDVLESKEKKSDLAVVISPACDFAHKKLDYIKIIPSTRINDTDLGDLEYLKKIKGEFGLKLTAKECAKAILTGRPYLPDRFYVLQYLKDNEGHLFHLMLDFQKVTNVQYKSTAELLEGIGWKRICRIDTPLIENLLQKYATYSSRIGVLEVPDEVAKIKVEKISDS
jgi:hypothetical protein